MNIKKPDNALIIQMIKAKKGNLSDVAKAFGVTRRSVSGWIAKNEKLKQAVEDERESMVDFAESMAFLLMKGIPITKKNNQTGKEEIVAWEEKPSERVILKVLNSKKGRERGWGDTIDVTTDGEKINQTPPFQLIIKVKDDDEGTDTEQTTS